MNSDVENHIRNKVPWQKLPSNLKSLLGNASKEYDKCIMVYSVKNQSRYRDSLVRHVRKDEKKYYEDLLAYSQEHLMLYPYHLSDIFVRGLRITPFNYYLDIIAGLMQAERSYDTLPNFTAFDCLRLLGIGRNQYIDLMNRYRSAVPATVTGITSSTSHMSSLSASAAATSPTSTSNRVAAAAAAAAAATATAMRIGGFAARVGVGGGGGTGAGGGVVSSLLSSRRMPVKSLLPTQPVEIFIEPWWLCNVGCVTDDDVIALQPDEKRTLDRLIDDERAVQAGKLDYDCVHALYRKGLIYLDVPLTENDFVEVPPLKNFVMNRITGDYFETLLYKLFVSIDDRTCLSELASLLQIDLELVINAVSLYCRLSFAVRKPPQTGDMDEYAPTWLHYQRRRVRSGSIAGSQTLLWKTANINLEDVVASTASLGRRPSLMFEETPTQQAARLSSTSSSTTPAIKETRSGSGSEMSNSTSLQQIGAAAGQSRRRRVAFMFDSTLTAFLMMGNLSAGLKNHAVTMFEVGKLSDQSIDNLVAELDKVSRDQNEGEAQRYFDHATIFKSTIQFLRNNKQLVLFSGSFQQEDKPNDDDDDVDDEDESAKSSRRAPIEDEPLGLDLLRCESLASLDGEARQRILAKNYSVLFSMSPYSSSGDVVNSPPVLFDAPYHVGPAIPEMNSVWFRLYLYAKLGKGPCSLLLPKGYRLTRLPSSFLAYDRFLLISWGHDPLVCSHVNLLIVLNESATHTPLFVACYGLSDDAPAHLVHMAFNDTTHPLFSLDVVQRAHRKFALAHHVGYLTLLRPSSADPLTTSSAFLDTVGADEQWLVIDMRYGLPLFDNKLNLDVLGLLGENKLASYANLNAALESNKSVSLEFSDFIRQHQKLTDAVDDYWTASQENNSGSSAAKLTKSIWPTQCLLFDDGRVRTFDDDC